MSNKEEIIYTEDLEVLKETIEFVRKFDFNSETNPNVEIAENKKAA